MFDEQKDKQVDEILDALLSQYSRGPRHGLERRILAGLRARAAQRRRVWTLMLAAPTAAALLIGLATHLRKVVPLPSHDRDASAARPALAADPGTTVASTPEGSGSHNLTRRRTKERLSRPTLLRVVDAMHRDSSLVFEHEKLYLDPAPQSDPRPAAVQEAAEPIIGIQDLGVKPIAIKELTSSKETDEEGKL